MYLLYMLFGIMWVMALTVNTNLELGKLSFVQMYTKGALYLPFSSTLHCKLAFFILFGKLLCRYIHGGQNPPFRPLFLLSSVHRHSRLRNIVLRLTLAFLLLNFLLIGIVNPSLLNPGPRNLSVYYQNVQGLIPFSHLKSSHPTLNQSKILELNAYINQNTPDIVMLSETWLKKSILDHEVIHSNDYKIFRTDRFLMSHPRDPHNPTKFRVNGGGVLIAVRADIDAISSRISTRKGVEMVMVEVKIGNSSLVFCNFYRVGTLGVENHTKFVDSVRPLLQGRRPKKVFKNYIKARQQHNREMYVAIVESADVVIKNKHIFYNCSSNY